MKKYNFKFPHFLVYKLCGSGNSKCLPTAARFHLDGYAVVHKALKNKA